MAVPRKRGIALPPPTEVGPFPVQMLTRPIGALLSLCAVAAFVTACGSNPNANVGRASGPNASISAGTVSRSVSAQSPRSSTPNGPTGSVAQVTESNPAGDIPDTQAFVPFAPASGGFSLKVPEGWARTSSGSAVLFTDKYNSIRIVSGTATKPPTQQSAQADLTAIGQSAPGFKPGQVSIVARSAGKATLVTYRADSPPNPVTGKVVVQSVERYKFYTSGKTVVLTLSAPAGSDNVDPWRTVTDSFRWTP